MLKLILLGASLEEGMKTGLQDLINSTTSATGGSVADVTLIIETT